MSGRRHLARSIHRVAGDKQRRSDVRQQIARVTRVRPLTVEPMDLGYTIQDDEVNLGQWVRAYMENTGLQRGDSLILQEISGQWVAVDVLSDKLRPLKVKKSAGGGDGTVDTSDSAEEKQVEEEEEAEAEAEEKAAEEEQAAIESLIAAAIADLEAPKVGEMKIFVGTVAPTGWLLCEGQAIARTGAYADLFALIGTTFGAGNGSTTFNVPDLRGRTPVGPDSGAGRLSSNNSLGKASGAQAHKLAESEIPSHKHGAGSLTTPYQQYNPQQYFSNQYNMYAAAGGFFAISGWASPTNVIGGSTANTGGGGEHNNMPPYQVVNFILKY